MEKKWLLFKDRLRELRLERKLTPKELGDEVGVSDTTITRWESGRRSPNLENIHRLVKFFGVKPGYLIGTEDY